MAQARCVLILLVSVLVAPANAQEMLRFSDIAGTTTLVYPAGPNITVFNPRALANVEVWVIRDLDGAVVRRYPVKAESIWKTPIEVNASERDEALATTVQEQNASLRFWLFLVAPDREVQERKSFRVRLNAPDIAPTASKVPELEKHFAYLASGKLEGIKGDEVFITPWSGSDPFSAYNIKASEPVRNVGAWAWKGGKEALAALWQGRGVVKAVSTDNTKVFESSGKSGAWMWPQVKSSLKVGDQVSLLYTETEGKKVAQELVVSTIPLQPSTSSITDPFAGLRFQIGTVVSAKVSAAAAAKSRDMILETKNADRRWRIHATTRITRGAVEGTRSDLAPKALVAVGAPELKGDEVLAAYVLLLKDVTEHAR